jgi:asparagine synthase (glutamine-hydrolysing)
MGFAVPLARWLRGPLRQRVTSVLQGERLAATGMFNGAYLGKLLNEHLSGAMDFSTPIWTVLMFDAYLKHTGYGSVPSAQERIAV